MTVRKETTDPVVEFGLRSERARTTPCERRHLPGEAPLQVEEARLGHLQ